MTKINKHKKKIVLVFLFLAILLISTEGVLRKKYGFCDAVLMQEDFDFEYIAQPNQNRFRLGNNILTNSLSMRSDEVDSSSTIILGFGDSVFNGGTPTDHDSLASTILSKKLSKKYQKKIQFLNISAGSWGADNCFAYLKRYGNFNAKSIYLFVNSHDAFDNMNFQKIVGINKNFPNKQYSFAIVELLERYIFPKVKYFFNSNKSKALQEEYLGINKKNYNSSFNSGFLDFYTYSIQNKISLTIYLHAEKIELKNKSYNNQGKEIIEFAKKHNIPLIMDLYNGLSEADFRDNIHLNAKGQKKMADIVYNYYTTVN